MEVDFWDGIQRALGLQMEQGRKEQGIAAVELNLH